MTCRLRPTCSTHALHARPNPAPLWILVVQGVLKLLQKGGHRCADRPPVFLRPICVSCCRVKGAALRLQRRGSSLANVFIQGPFLSRQSCSSAPHVWDWVLVGTTHQQQALSHDLQASSHMQHACFARTPQPRPPLDSCCAGCSKTFAKGGSPLR